jgi:hypothetical protein
LKYPKTMHLPYSPGLTKDDKVIKDMSYLEKADVVITEKLDGENTCMEHGKIHARSEGSSNHPSRDFVKGIHASIRHLIPENCVIFGENMFAKHSIEYPDLQSAFYVFNVFDKEIQCFLDWNAVQTIALALNLMVVPTIYVGPYKEIPLPKTSLLGPECEGYVVRTLGKIAIENFDKLIAKYVRANHVQTDEHWKRNWVPNPPWRKK